jgi:energy-coupling factor transporter ATP-binding protein EcfA2
MEFTGRENVFLNGAILGLSKQEMQEKYEKIIEFADIGDFINQPVKTYSSGMFVRLAFAVQAMVEPEILIVDEALSVGDLAFQNKCIKLLNNLIDKGTTVFFCSHDISTVQRICSSAIWIDKGTMRQYGNPSDVCAAYVAELTKEYESPHQQPREASDERCLRTQQTTGFAHFAKLEIDKSVYLPKQSMLISYELEADEDIKEYCLGLSIYNSANVWLIGQCSFDDKCILGGLKAGEQRAGTVRIPELRLASGDYLLYLGIHSSDYKEYYALNTNPIKFTIRSGNPSWGCISIPIEWDSKQ